MLDICGLGIIVVDDVSCPRDFALGFQVTDVANLIT
jgi:hypothetical protein